MQNTHRRFVKDNPGDQDAVTKLQELYNLKFITEEEYHRRLAEITG
jgi:hypothetical protein